MRKKFILVLVTVMLAAVLLSGCNGGVNNTLIKEKNISAFDSVYVTTSSSIIEFVASDYYGLEILIPERFNPEWDVTNGQLTIYAKTRESLFIPSITFSKSYVKVYCPAEAVFNEITLKSSSGSIELPKVFASDLDVSTSSGKINASVENCDVISAATSSGSVTLECSGDLATALTVSTSSGSIRADGTAWRDIMTKTQSGATEISGELFGDTYVKATSGNVILNVNGDPSQYGYSLTPSSGSIHWNGIKMEKPAHSTGSFDNNIVVDTSSGSIRVEFSQP